MRSPLYLFTVFPPACESEHVFHVVNAPDCVARYQQMKGDFDKDEDDMDLTDESKWDDIHCIRCAEE